MSTPRHSVWSWSIPLIPSDKKGSWGSLLNPSEVTGQVTCQGSSLRTVLWVVVSEHLAGAAEGWDLTHASLAKPGALAWGCIHPQRRAPVSQLHKGTLWASSALETVSAVKNHRQRQSPYLATLGWHLTFLLFVCWDVATTCDWFFNAPKWTQTYYRKFLLPLFSPK